VLLTEQVFTAACAAGHLQLCEQLIAKGCPVSPVRSSYEPLLEAAGGGHQAVCGWLLSSRGVPWDAEAVYAALAGGHMALAEWLLAQYPLLQAAAQPQHEASHSSASDSPSSRSGPSRGSGDGHGSDSSNSTIPTSDRSSLGPVSSISGDRSSSSSSDDDEEA
jgi:hypothetical protein